MNIYKLIFIVLVLSITGLVIVSTNISADKEGSGLSSSSVLIAFEKTRFKSALVEEMKSILESNSIKVTIIDHKKKGLEGKSSADYSAVFITNSGVDSKIRPWVTTWIKKQKDTKSFILLHTTQTKSWTPETDVDAVTSASSNKDTKKLAAQYTDRIIKALKTPK